MTSGVTHLASTYISSWGFFWVLSFIYAGLHQLFGWRPTAVQVPTPDRCFSQPCIFVCVWLYLLFVRLESYLCFGHPQISVIFLDFFIQSYII